MSAQPIAVEPVVAVDGFGPESRGHNVPVLRTPAKIAAHIARLTMPRGGDSPLLPEPELIALLYALAERYAAARERRESFEATVVLRTHDGRHRGFWFDESRKLSPPLDTTQR